MVVAAMISQKKKNVFCFVLSNSVDSGNTYDRVLLYSPISQLELRSDSNVTRITSNGPRIFFSLWLSSNCHSRETLTNIRNYADFITRPSSLSAHNRQTSEIAAP